MSIPSSSALVATTARILPVAQPLLHAPPRLRQVAAAVRHDRVGVDGGVARELVAQVLEHHLHAVARLAEDDGRHPGAHQIGGQVDRALPRAGADAQLGVDHRRVVEEEAPLARGRARVAHQLDLVRRGAEQARGVLARVADGGRGAEKDGIRPVEAGGAPEAGDHVRDVRSEDAAIGVQLVEDHVAQLLEGARPVRVVGEDAGVDHVRVGHHDGAALARGAARVPRGVAVVDDRGDGEARLGDELAQPRLLIAGEGLGGVEVEGAGVGLAGEGLQHRQMEAEALPARRGRGDDDVLAAAGSLVRARLVLVEPRDAARAQGAGQGRGERLGKGSERRRGSEAGCAPRRGRGGRSPRRARQRRRRRARWACSREGEACRGY